MGKQSPARVQTRAASRLMYKNPKRRTWLRIRKKLIRTKIRMRMK
jgi:hypothetical protein